MYMYMLINKSLLMFKMLKLMFNSMGTITTVTSTYIHVMLTNPTMNKTEYKTCHTRFTGICGYTQKEPGLTF
jgi:hypothetical protein